MPKSVKSVISTAFSIGRQPSSARAPHLICLSVNFDRAQKDVELKLSVLSCNTTRGMKVTLLSSSSTRAAKIPSSHKSREVFRKSLSRLAASNAAILKVFFHKLSGTHNGVYATPT